MKYLLITSLCLFNMSAFSNEKKMHRDWDKKVDKMSFEDAQKMKLEMLDKKSSLVDDEKKCVKDAKDKAELKKCMKEGYEKHESMKKEAKKDMKEKDEKKM